MNNINKFLHDLPEHLYKDLDKKKLSLLNKIIDNEDHFNSSETLLNYLKKDPCAKHVSKRFNNKFEDILNYMTPTTLFFILSISNNKPMLTILLTESIYETYKSNNKIVNLKDFMEVYSNRVPSAEAYTKILMNKMFNKEKKTDNLENIIGKSRYNEYLLLKDLEEDSMNYNNIINELIESENIIFIVEQIKDLKRNDEQDIFDIITPYALKLINKEECLNVDDLYEWVEYIKNSYEKNNKTIKVENIKEQMKKVEIRYNKLNF